MQTIKAIIHDLNNQATIAYGNLNKLAESGDVRALKAHFAITRMIELLKLAGRHLNESEQVSVNVAQEMASTGSLMFDMMSKNYDLEVELDLESQRLSVDLNINQHSMIRIIENIFDNAKKAGASKILICDRVENGFVVSKFADNGSGCKQDSKIGSGFTTGGTGVGTVFIKDEMNKMGGSAHWISTDVGMVVTLTFPIAQRKAA